MNKRPRILLPMLVLVLWLGAWLRLHDLSGQSFWNDEGNSARLSERSPRLIVEGTAADVHPPLYYLALRGWRELVGETEFGLRAFSAAAGILTIAVTAGLGRLLAARQALPLLAAFLAATHPALVYYSREARMYALVALLAAGSTLLLGRQLSAWQTPGRQGRTGWLAGAYLLSLAAGLYTHYVFPVVVGVHAVYVWLRAATWRRRLGWLGLAAGAGLLFIPWLPIFQRQIGTRAPADVPAGAFLAEALRFLYYGETLGAATARWGVLAALLLTLLALSAFRRRPLWLVAGAGLLLPPLMLLAVGATRPAFAKLLLVGAPFASLLLARGVDLGWSVQGRRAGFEAARLVTGLLLVLVLGTVIQSLVNLYVNPEYTRADYRGLAARIAAEDVPDAGIILNAPNQWEVFTYYHRDGAPVYPVPRGAPDAAAIATELSDIVSRHDRLYVLYWGEAERDPERLVERWLDQNTFKATEEWVGDVRFVVYAVPGPPAEAIERVLGWRFGDTIRLDGVALGETALAPAEILTVTLFWRALAPIDERYKVFLHLVGPNGLLAQRDSEPGGGLALTTTWVPGAPVADNHGVLVPADAPAGDYTLLLGLYELGDPTARLPIALDGASADAAPLGVVTVRKR